MRRTPAALFTAMFTVLSASAVGAPVTPKPETSEFKLFHGDKGVGKETLRIQKGASGTYYSTQANVQDKVGKVWRAFVQRTLLPLQLDGAVQQYDRWIDVTGATLGTKLFQFQGFWRIAEQEPAEDGKKPKPKLAEVKGLQPPFVVLDERVQALVWLAGLRMAGKHSEFAYVRVDDASSGKMTLEVLDCTDKIGKTWHKWRMKGTGPGVNLEVVRNAKGEIASIDGIDPWRAVSATVKGPDGTCTPVAVVLPQAVTAAEGVTPSGR
jgi:hypothetical protein